MVGIRRQAMMVMVWYSDDIMMMMMVSELDDDWWWWLLPGCSIPGTFASSSGPCLPCRWPSSKLSLSSASAKMPYFVIFDITININIMIMIMRVILMQDHSSLCWLLQWNVSSQSGSKSFEELDDDHHHDNHDDHEWESWSMMIPWE